MDKRMERQKEVNLQIETEREIAYGGDQSWFPRKGLKKSGCGVSSGANVLLYLLGKQTISKMQYVDFCKTLWQSYLPVIPYLGMNGITLMIGMNRYFKKHRMPYRAYWRISKKKMLGRIDQMLTKGIPIILSVGPNVPKIWEKESLTLYRKDSAGQYQPVNKTRAHFVTITGREEMWLIVSSWGKRYAIDLGEWKRYVSEYSSYMVSNVLEIRKIKGS